MSSAAGEAPQKRRAQITRLEGVGSEKQGLLHVRVTVMSQSSRREGKQLSESVAQQVNTLGCYHQDPSWKKRRSGEWRSASSGQVLWSPVPPTEPAKVSTPSKSSAVTPLPRPGDRQ
jgi:hypothetical protein